MNLAVNPPVLPMLAKRVDALPSGDEWIFEPKWDGFRALIFREDDEIYIQSRDGKPLNRYFPELLDPMKSSLPGRCVLDGEIVIVKSDGLDFDELQLRLHPAASRVRLLSARNPASVVFFDLLCHGADDLREMKFQVRRERLVKLLSSAAPPLHLTPATTDLQVATDWFRRFEGAGLDGVIAKPLDGVYEPNKRVMLKVKHERDCDCVVAGFRWHKKGEGEVGSLLLGLYDVVGRPAAYWRLFQFQRRETPGIGRAFGTLSERCSSSSSMERMGGGRRAAADSWRPKSLEPGQGSLVGTPAAGTCL